jgi:protein TonB
MNFYQDLLDGHCSAARRWAAAGLVVTALHVGGAALALMTVSEEPDSEMQGAMVVELASIAMSPQDDRENLAIGPRADDSEARTAPVEAAREVKPEETAPVEKQDRVDEPVITLPKAEPEQQEEVEETKPQEVQPAPATIASVAAAPPPIEAAPSPVPVAPVQGTSRVPSSDQLTWQKSLVLHLNRHKQYPVEARRRQIQGTVTINFSIDREGVVLTPRIVEGSGSGLLDDAAVDLLRRASPLPKPPNGISPDALTMSVPVKFGIR